MTFVVSMLFCARTHTWLQRCGGNIARLGLTARGLEDVGSIDRMVPLVRVGDRIDIATPLMEIEWSAYRVSAADELYHSAWENVEGIFTLEGPAACTLRALHHIALAKPHDLCDETWLAEVELDESMPYSGLVDAEAYAAHVAGLDRGPFAEEDPARGDMGMKLAYFGSAQADQVLGILCPESVARAEVAV